MDCKIWILGGAQKPSFFRGSLYIGLGFLLFLKGACLGGAFASSFKDEVIPVGGLRRVAHIYTPSDDWNLPVVLAFHGGHGEGRRLDEITHLSVLAQREKFILVYPEGIDKSWNDGRPEKKNPADDLGFTGLLLDLLIQKYHADPKRVFVTGISNGGLFSFRLACELSDRITAIAPVVANLGEVLSTSCHPKRAIPILNIVGTKDPLMHFGGGQITGPLGFKKLGAILSSDATVLYWVKAYHCGRSPNVTEVPDVAKDGTTIQRQDYSECQNGATVSRITMVGAGHTWAGGKSYLPASLIGKTSKNLNASEEIWKFFKR